jgi:hypothetical protein
MSSYPVKIQAVRSKGCAERPFVNIPIPIARALDIRKGELVEWKIVDRSQILLVREPQPSPLKPPPKS